MLRPPPVPADADLTHYDDMPLEVRRLRDSGIAGVADAEVFRRDEGVKARDRSAAARGNVLSGGQQKAIEQFGQDIGSEEWTNHFNRLMGLSGGGEVATSNANSTAAGLTGAGSNLLYQGGAFRGSAYAQGANALASGIGNGMQNALFLGTLAGGGLGRSKGASPNAINYGGGNALQGYF